jgi:purine-binding chemotaxis protein CheW
LGILVDSVDEIIMTNEGNVVELSPLDKQDKGRGVTADVFGCLRTSLPDDKIDSIMILDSVALADRCLSAAE